MEHVSPDGLRRRRRNHGPSEYILWSTMGQWADDEVGIDPADCPDAIPSCRARRRIGGEHAAGTHDDVPLRWRSNRDPRLRQLLAAVPPCATRPQSQERSAGIALPVRYAPYFKPGKDLRERLNRAHESSLKAP